jgi:CARDB/Sortilin, neurotensin receptor 3,
MIRIISILMLLAVVVNAQQRRREETRPDEMADVAVQSLTVSPEFPEPGEPVQIRLEVQNRGSARVQRAQISFLADGQPFATHPLMVVEQTVQTVTLSWTPTTSGLHSISAIVDPKYVLIERDRLDNTAVREVVVAQRPPQGADLVVADVQTAAGPDRPTLLRVTIRNNGKVQASAPLLVRQGESRRVLLAGPVDPGKTSKIEIPWGADSNDPVNVEVDPRFRSAGKHGDKSFSLGNNSTSIDLKEAASNIDRWVSIGPDRITGSAAFGIAWNDATGRLSAIAIHPTSPQTMYVAGQQSGVWKTTNGGTNWVPITDAVTVRVAALALDPNNPARVYLVTPNEGVYRSEDSGTSWIKVASDDLDAMVYPSVLSINPANSKDMVLASNKGVYRSIDAGKTWVLKLKNGKATGLVRRPSDPNTLYAALRHDTDANVAGIYQSFDAGETWFPKQGCPGGSLPGNDENTLIHLAVSGDQLYASYRRNDPVTFKLFRTKGEGCSFGGALDVSWEAGWSTSGDNAKTLWSDMSADPTNPRIVYLGGTFFWKSTDRGSSFSKTSGDTSPSNSAHVDHHKIVTDPVSPNVVYTLNDGGIYKSTNRGASSTWQFIGAGIANVEFYDLAAAVTRPDLVIGGTQDNGTLKSVSGSTTWTMIRKNDGSSVDIDPTNANVMYSMEQYASSIRRSTNGGASFPFNAAGGLPTGSVCQNLPFQIHPQFPTKLLASCNSLWQTSNSGGTWSNIFTPATGTITRSAIDGPADVYYAGSSMGVVTHRSSTFITSVSRTIFTHPDGMGVTDMELDRANTAVLYAAFQGRGFRRIYRLVRSNNSPPTFTATDISSDLPFALKVQTLAVDRNHPFTIFAGTDKGVYRGRSINGGATWFWQSYMNGMPPADVRDLEVHPVTGVIRAATYGRSAYEVNTDDPVGSVLSVRGKITFLRVHDVGTGFGPPTDQIDGEVIVKFDSDPVKAFGFQLRTDNNEDDHQAMLKTLRDALRRDRIVEVEYFRTGPTTGRVVRIIQVR